MTTTETVGTTHAAESHEVVSVVVGVDGSETSRDALAWGADEAAALGASLDVVFAEYQPILEAPFVSGVYVDPDASVERYGRATLDAAEQFARGRVPGVTVRTHLRAGQPFDVLVRLAEERAPEACMVVVGADGVGAVGRGFVGSVGVRVAARSGLPTVVVPPRNHAGPVDDGLAAGLADEHLLPAPAGSVVVGVDGSPHGDTALRAALDQARRRGVGLTVVGASVPGHREVARRRALAALTRVTDQGTAATAPGGADVTVLGTDGSPAHALASVGACAALVVVGAHGRRSPGSTVLGHTAHELLHVATAPVMVVPHPPELEDAVERAATRGADDRAGRRLLHELSSSV